MIKVVVVVLVVVVVVEMRMVTMMMVMMVVVVVVMTRAVARSRVSVRRLGERPETKALRRRACVCVRSCLLAYVFPSSFSSPSSAKAKRKGRGGEGRIS